MSSEWCKKNGLTLFGENIPDPFYSFEDALMFAKAVRKSFIEQNFTKPTPIQAQSWPILMNKRDLIGIAKTGSGKTLAFMAPIITLLKHNYNAEATGPQVLVLSPTRELAIQIDVEVKKVLPKNIFSVVIYGGVSKTPQIDALNNGTQIVIATPGRLLDLMEMGVTHLKNISYLIFDEADRMLDMGFEPSVKAICKTIPTDRLTAMFSATWPESVQELAASFQKDAIRIHMGSTELTANTDINQKFIFVRKSWDKLKELRKILAQNDGKKILVFALFKKSVRILEEQLREFKPITISSDKSQEAREFALKKFKSINGSLLIATDVAARGLDIKQLELVINYEFPLQVDDYIHRIGRTGRAGDKGTAITILADDEAYYDGFAARDLEAVLQKANQPVPKQISSKAENFRYRARPTKAKFEKIPEAPTFQSTAPSKAIKFNDSDDEPPFKKSKL